MPTSSHVEGVGRSLSDRLQSIATSQNDDVQKRFFSVYRRQDKGGIWHYADRPRPDGTGQVVVMDSEHGVTVLPVHKIAPVRSQPMPQPGAPKKPPAPPSMTAHDFPVINPLHIKAKALETKAALEAHYERQRQASEKGHSP